MMLQDPHSQPGMGFVIAMLTAITIILGPIAWALARRLGRKADPDSALRAEVDQLHTRLAEMDSLQARVLELEERVDFAERLLAQAQQPARLGAPTEEGGR
jgi:anti-sigma-K factor RskA